MINKKTEEAFFWIIDILEKYQISFQISGGLAARIYGANRPLADIDIGVHDNIIDLIKSDVEKFIIYGPERYIDKEFDLLLMTLKYKGQEIDIYGIDSENIFDKNINKWVKENTDLSKAIQKKVFGRSVPVVPLEDLICYKKKISRDVDIFDVNVLSK